MSTPDPRTERAQLDKWLLQTNRYPGTVTAGEAAQHLYDAAVKANDALTTEAARVRGETWREALEKVANDWASKGFCGHDEIQSIEVQAFLDTRHVHYPECRGELSKPTWSTARPTVEGFYWYRDDEVGPTVVEVYEVAGALAVDQFDRGSGLPLKAFNGEWCPIARPGEEVG